MKHSASIRSNGPRLLTARVPSEPLQLARFPLPCGSRANRKLFRVITSRPRKLEDRSQRIKILMGQRKSCVPDTFQLGAIPDAGAFLACRKINNLSVFNTPEYSDSPRLHQSFFLILKGLHGPVLACTPDVPLLAVSRWAMCGVHQTPAVPAALLPTAHSASR
jgi:hypothetical protein